MALQTAHCFKPVMMKNLWSNQKIHTINDLDNSLPFQYWTFWKFGPLRPWPIGWIRCQQTYAPGTANLFLPIISDQFRTKYGSNLATHFNQGPTMCGQWLIVFAVTFRVNMHTLVEQHGLTQNMSECGSKTGCKCCSVAFCILFLPLPLPLTLTATMNQLVSVENIETFQIDQVVTYTT